MRRSDTWMSQIYVLGLGLGIDYKEITAIIDAVIKQSGENAPKDMLYERAWRKIIDRI